MKLGVAAIFFALAIGCPQPHPQPPPGPDADAAPRPTFDAASPCGSACYHMQQIPLECPEGFDSECVKTCEHIVASDQTPFDPACIIDAQTVDAVRHCKIKCKKP